MQAFSYGSQSDWAAYQSELNDFLSGHHNCQLVVSSWQSFKAVVLTSWVESVDSAWQVDLLEGTQALTPRGLLQHLCREFAVDSHTVGESFRTGSRIFLDQLDSSHQRVLVIDQAERLPIATQAALMHLILLQSNAQSRLKICLVGNQAMPSLFQRFYPDALPVIRLMNQRPEDAIISAPTEGAVNKPSTTESEELVTNELLSEMTGVLQPLIATMKKISRNWLNWQIS